MIARSFYKCYYSEREKNMNCEFGYLVADFFSQKRDKNCKKKVAITFQNDLFQAENKFQFALFIQAQLVKMTSDDFSVKITVSFFLR